MSKAIGFSEEESSHSQAWGTAEVRVCPPSTGLEGSSRACVLKAFQGSRRRYFETWTRKLDIWNLTLTLPFLSTLTFNPSINHIALTSKYNQNPATFHHLQQPLWFF